MFISNQNIFKSKEGHVIASYENILSTYNDGPDNCDASPNAEATMCKKLKNINDNELLSEIYFLVALFQNSLKV